MQPTWAYDRMGSGGIGTAVAPLGTPLRWLLRAQLRSDPPPAVEAGPDATEAGAAGGGSRGAAGVGSRAAGGAAELSSPVVATWPLSMSMCNADSAGGEEAGASSGSRTSVRNAPSPSLPGAGKGLVADTATTGGAAAAGGGAGE